MPLPKSSSSNVASVPLIMPKAPASVEPTCDSSVNIFKMILEESHRAKPVKPVVDLEADVAVVDEASVEEGPIPKKRRDLKEDCDSDDVPVTCLESKFDSSSADKRESPPSLVEEIDLTVEDSKQRARKKPTLRDVLNQLCDSGEVEEGEILENIEEDIIDLTSEELNLTLRSQVDGEVIDLTVDNDECCIASADQSRADDDVICVEDLTLIDDDRAVSIMSIEKSGSHKRRHKKRMSFRASVCSNMQRKPSKDDALSRATFECNGVSPRHWETFRAAPTPSSSNTEFRVCCYNVLCQSTTMKTMYLYNHLRADDRPLQWEHRWPILEQELIRLNADIYGLQEVQYDHYESCFRASLSRVGYSAFYKKRTGLMNDGCAIFVRKTKFEVVSYRVVEYFVAPGTSMDRDQIGQILRLRCRKTGQEIVYANTHLIFNSARGDIKIGQLAMLFANISDELSKSSCPVIINGDFNIEPLSYVYTYVSESSVYLRGLPRNELSGQGQHGGPCVRAEDILPSIANIARDSMFINDKAPRDAVAADYFTHPFTLASVYHHFNENGEKEVSTYHKEVANPDFIFYSIEKKKTVDSSTQVFEVPELRLLRRLGLPDLTTLEKTLGPWPNYHVPSDHIPLVADFVLSKTDSKL
ncbi:hypothetical protein Q1695_002858 [Nippostrongylus brasiliensis]|nr:hypothetical protein Q1695_002858 [Nippostrongylus brasiliensis]